MPARARWYDLTFETLSPLHTSLGPEELLIPDQECDLAGPDRTVVLDREAVIAALLGREEETPAAPPEPPQIPRRRTYREALADRDHPDYETIRDAFLMGRRLGL